MTDCSARQPHRFSFTGIPVWLALAVVLCDQVTKQAVLHLWPVVGHQVVVIPNLFHLVHFRNPGAAWGMLSRFTYVLTLVSVAVIAGIVAWFDRLTEGVAWRAIALALILGGVTGNLIDRMVYREVIDFLFFHYRSFQWPAFNIADCAITVGVFLFILSSFLHGTERTDCASPRLAPWVDD